MGSGNINATSRHFTLNTDFASQQQLKTSGKMFNSRLRKKDKMFRVRP